MGAYLSTPVTDKLSSDETSEKQYMSYGASSMQGWRMSQEDAHNTILDFDEDTSYFAVYDGHGGHEVATYCALNLPDFLKNTEAYKNGDMPLALRQAYLGFDALLTEEKVIKELKIIAGDKKRGENDSEDEDPEEVSHLYEEATMSLEDLVQRYKTQPIPPSHAKALRDSSKPASPFLRAKLSASEPESEGTSSAEAGASSSISHQVDEPSTDKADNGQVEDSKGEKEEALSSSAEDRAHSSKTGDNGEKNSDPAPAANGEGTTTENGTVEHTAAAVSKGKGKGKGKSNLVKRNLQLTPEEAAKLKAEEERLEKISERKKSLRAQTGEQLYQRLAASNENEEESEDDEDDKEDADFDASEDDNSDDYEDIDDEDDSEDGEDEEGETDFTMNMKEEPGSDSGCTAVVALLKGLALYVANAGDSRAVLCRGGVAKDMSFDHKPEDEPESARIVKAGGTVTGDGRVNGGLNLSRAIGDHAYKQNKDLPPEEQMISALPDIETTELQPGEDEFLVLACDGIWNSMSNQQVVDFVRPRLNSGPAKISQICEELFDACLADDTMGDGSGCDNMTAIIVRFDWKDNQLKTEQGSASVGTKRPLSPGTSPSAAARPTEEPSESSKRLKTDSESEVQS